MKIFFLLLLLLFLCDEIFAKKFFDQKFFRKKILSKKLRSKNSPQVLVDVISGAPILESRWRRHK